MLLTEKDLNDEKALETANAMETAARDAIELRKYQSVNAVSVKPPTKKKCYRCTGTNHMPDDCKYKTAVCHKCKKTGHIKRACLADIKGNQGKNFEKKKKVHALDDNPSDEESFLGNLEEQYANVDSMKADVIWIETKIQNKPAKMELGTGSAVSIIPLSMYKELFRRCKLKESTLKLRTYSGETIFPEGQINVKVEVNGQKHLNLHVVNSKGSALFARDWLSKLNLDWSQIKMLHFTETMTVEGLKQKYKNIYDELGTVTGIQARIKVKPDSNPVFC